MYLHDSICDTAKLMIEMKRKLVLILYYTLLQHLPRTDRFCIKWVRRLRSKVGYYLFDHYGGVILRVEHILVMEEACGWENHQDLALIAKYNALVI